MFDLYGTKGFTKMVLVVGDTIIITVVISLLIEYIGFMGSLLWYLFLFVPFNLW